MGDLDNDGDVDVVLAQLGGYKITWAENLGEGVFAPSLHEFDSDRGILYRRFGSVAVGDLDGDLGKDVVAVPDGFDGEGAFVTLYFQTSGPEFTGLSWMAIDLGGEDELLCHTVGLYDVDQDGWLDLVLPGNYGSAGGDRFYVVWNRSPLSVPRINIFDASTAPPAPPGLPSQTYTEIARNAIGSTYTVEVVDLTGNGYLDLFFTVCSGELNSRYQQSPFTTSNGFYFILQTGNRTFATNSPIGHGNTATPGADIDCARGAALYDFNGDSFLDVIVGCAYNNFIDIWLHDGSTNFDPASGYNPYGQPERVFVPERANSDVDHFDPDAAAIREIRMVDVNMDGRPDIVFATEADSSVNVYLNILDPGGNADSINAYSSERVQVTDDASGIASFLIHDFDDDAVPDILIPESARGFVRWARSQLWDGTQMEVLEVPANNTVVAFATSTTRFTIPLRNTTGEAVFAVPSKTIGSGTLVLGRTETKIDPSAFSIHGPGVIADAGDGAVLTLDILPPSPGQFQVTVSLSGVPMPRSPLILVAQDFCFPGSVRAGFTECTECPPATYADEPNAAECSECPPFSTSLKASVSVSNCSCFAGFYTNSPGAACITCPAGGTCAGGLSLPVAAPGFFSSPDNPTVFLVCPRPKSCAGGDRCNPGYSESLCAVCAEGYYSSAIGECLKCPSSPAFSLILLMSIIGVCIFPTAALLVWITSRMEANLDAAAGESKSQLVLAFRKRSVPASASLIIVAFQVVAILAETDYAWTPDSRQLLETFAVFAIDTSALANECSLSSFHQKYVFSVLFPAAFILGVVVVAILAGRFVMPSSLSLVGTVDMVIFHVCPIFFIPVVRRTATLFDCSELANGVWALDSDPGTTCFDGAWWAVAPVGFAGMVMYALGIPAYLGGHLFMKRDSLADVGVMLRFGAIYSLYARDLYFTGVADLLKRLLIVVAAVFLSSTQLFQIALLHAAILTWLLFVLKRQPYVSLDLNGLDSRLSVCLVGILMVGAASYANRDGESLNTALLGALIFGLLVLILVAIHGLVVDCIAIYRARRNVSFIRSRRRVRLARLIERELDDTEADEGMRRSANHFLESLYDLNHLDYDDVAGIDDDEFGRDAPYSVDKGGVEMNSFDPVDA